jgi:hypothetical protein
MQAIAENGGGAHSGNRPEMRRFVAGWHLARFLLLVG